MSTIQENKMGTLPVGKLLFSMALPIALSMFAVSLYGFVDSFFVSKLGETALAGMTLAATAQSFMNGIINGTNTGVSALIARRLGEGKRDGASSAAEHGMLLSIIIGLIFAIFGGIFTEYFLGKLTKDVATIAYSAAYMRPIALGMIAIATQLTMQTILIATGNAKHSSIVQIFGVVLNIILDPIFIFTLNFGIAGAAYATIISAVLAASLGLYFNLTRNKEITLFVNHFRPKWRTIRLVYAVAMPSILLIVLFPLTWMVAASCLGKFSTAAVAVDGAFARCEDLILLPIIGINGAIIPIVSFNSGTRKPKRIKEAVIKGAICANAFSLAGLAMLVLFNQQLLTLFSATQEMLEIGRWGFPIMAGSYLFLGARIIMGGALQALRKGKEFLIIIAVRQVVIVVPMLIIFSNLRNMPVMLCAWFFGELVAFPASLWVATRAIKAESLRLSESPALI